MRRSSRNTAHGISLVEVLVALIIFSVGLLALAGLQSGSLIENRVSYLRSQAVMLASDMADRMRANPRGVDNGDYDSTTPVGGSTNAACYSSAGCTPAQMAAHDQAAWATALGQLPNGGGIICTDSTPYDGTPGSPACDVSAVSGMDMYTIKVFWERGGDQRFSTQVRINR